jgi:hypothetical protein
MSQEDLQAFIKSQAANTIKWYQKNLLDILKDNWTYIIECNMAVAFTEKTIKRMRPFITKEFNLLKSVINQISMVYKNKPIRKAMVGEKSDEVYEQAVKKSRIDDRMRTNNRLVNTLNHTLVRPYVKDDLLRYEILSFDNCAITTDPDDPLRIVGVQYYTGLVLPDYDGVYRTNTRALDSVTPMKFESYSCRHVWTLEARAEGGEEICVYRRFKFVGNTNSGLPKEEPAEEIFDVYRDKKGRAALPYVLFSKEEPHAGLLDFTTGADLVDGCLGVALLMVQLWHVIKYQSFKQGYIVGKNVPDEFLSDPSAWIALSGGIDGKASSSAGVLDVQSNYDRLWALIKERVSLVLAQYGVSPSQFFMTSSPQSGYALQVQNGRIVEKREEDLPRYSQYEQELYDKTVMVWNTDKSEAERSMATDAVFSIEYGDVAYPIDTASQVQLEQHELTNALTSPVSLIMKRNESLTKEQAEKEYAENKEYKPQAMSAKELPNLFEKAAPAPVDEESEEPAEGEGMNAEDGAQE